MTIFARLAVLVPTDWKSYQIEVPDRDGEVHYFDASALPLRLQHLIPLKMLMLLLRLKTRILMWHMLAPVQVQNIPI